jgi:sigma-B regulation protein RsbU (phosphoserine phosphatase)
MIEQTPAQRTDRFDLRALYETSQLLSASLDLAFVLNNLLLTGMSKLLVTRGIALLYDPVERHFRVAAVKGLPSLKTGDAVHLEASVFDRLCQGDDVPALLADQRIVLMLPVASGHRQIGLIGLGKKATGQPFESQELEFIQSLVNMSSAAVHNSLMVEELRQANRDLDGKIQQLNTLFDLSQEFNATVERDRLAKLLSFALMGQMTVAKHLFLLRGAADRDGDGREDDDFRVVASKGIANGVLEPPLLEALGVLDTLLWLKEEEEIDPQWTGLVKRGISLVLPIRQQGETRALLCLGRKMTGQPYQPDDIEFLYALGNLAFVSIQNSYLVEEQIEKEKLEEEMRLARQIQEKLQPQDIPRFEGLDIATVAIPSRHVAGDYFDVVRLASGRLLLAIADVTGKGVPASLLMSNLQACLHVMLPMEVSLEEATGHINRVICENTTYDKFITFVQGIYDPNTRTFRYVNAGHNPPMLLRADGTFELLETGGVLLGVMKGLPYESGTVTLGPGDVLALFTDGVTEAMSPTEEEYGEPRLEAALRAHQSDTAQGLLDAVLADIRTFTEHVPVLSDDLTMIVVKVL